MPLAVSATTVSGRNEPTSTNDTTWSAHSPSRSSSRRAPVIGGTGSPRSFSRQRLDVGEPGVAPDGTRAREAHLDPVVPRGVVRRREHRPGRIEVARGEVQEIGRGHAEVGDVDALGPDAIGEGAGERHPRLTHVTGHEDLGGGGEAGHGAPDGQAHVRVELVGHRAAHVVGLEDLVHPAHRATTIGAARTVLKRKSPHASLGPACSVDDAALRGDGDDGHKVEAAVRHHVHPEASRPIRDDGEDDAEDGEAGQLDPLAVGQAEEQPVDDDGHDDSGGPRAAGGRAAASSDGREP